MENTAKIIVLFISIFLVSNCKKVREKEGDKLVSVSNIQKCKNDESLFTSVNSDLLYKDSLDKIYLKRKNEFPKDYPIRNECQKLPFVFLKEMALKNDSIVTINAIIDSSSFSRFEGTDIYFHDNNGVYAYNNAIATYPNFYQIDVNKEGIRVVDSITLQGEGKVFLNGMMKQ